MSAHGQMGPFARPCSSRKGRFSDESRERSIGCVWIVTGKIESNRA